MTKKLFLILMVLLMGLSACAPAAAPAPAPEEEAAPVEKPAPAEEAAPAEEEALVEETMDPVTFQVFYPVAVDAPIAEILNGYVEDFQAEYPYITVEPVFSGGYGDVQTAIQTTIDGGGEPPALAVMLATALYDLTNADYIAPLDGYVDAMENGDAYIADFLPVFLDNSYAYDQLWSIPFQRSATVMYYNMDMFAEAGLEAPTNWENWAAAAQTLTTTDGDVTNWGLQYPSGWPYWLFQPLAIGAGQNILTDDCSVVFNNPAVIDAIQFYIDLSAEYGAMPAGVQGVWGTAPTDFSSGATAMIIHSSGSLKGIVEQAGFEVGLMGIPGKEDGAISAVPGGGNFYIMSGAPQEQQDAAWLFVEFITSPEYVADYSINTGYIASSFSSYDTEAMLAHTAEVPQALSARDALNFGGAELATQNLGAVRGISHDYLQRAYNGEMTADEAMTAAQAEADAALVDFCE